MLPQKQKNPNEFWRFHVVFERESGEIKINAENKLNVPCEGWTQIRVTDKGYRIVFEQGVFWILSSALRASNSPCKGMKIIITVITNGLFWLKKFKHDWTSDYNG